MRPEAEHEETGDSRQSYGRVEPEELPRPEGLGWIFLNAEGLRCGWSAGLFAATTALLFVALEIIAALLRVSGPRGFSPRSALVEKLIEASAVVLATAFMMRIEELRPAQLYLGGTKAVRRFGEGLATGFVTLSALVGVQMAGGWMRLGGPELPWASIAGYAALWAAVFLATGVAEEGAFRGYLLRTLAAGGNLGGAAAAVATLCLIATLRENADGARGVYTAAIAGLLLCLVLQWRRSAEARFWQAAWITSVAFGFWHLGNRDESWVGIVVASLVGVVFCASIRLTGTLWWAIGCHAAWDWAETFFWGAADSGLPAEGHFFSVTPAGNALLSGGAVGPEGSLLALLVLLALLGMLFAVYRQKKDAS